MEDDSDGIVDLMTAPDSGLHNLSREFWGRFSLQIAKNNDVGIAEWAEQNGAATVVVDDSSHSTSTLVLIPHANDERYMGTSVIFVPQCSSERDNFFLYPRALDELIDALTKIREKYKK